MIYSFDSTLLLKKILLFRIILIIIKQVHLWPDIHCIFFSQLHLSPTFRERINYVNNQLQRHSSPPLTIVASGFYECAARAHNQNPNWSAEGLSLILQATACRPMRTNKEARADIPRIRINNFGMTLPVFSSVHPHTHKHFVFPLSFYLFLHPSLFHSLCEHTQITKLLQYKVEDKPQKMRNVNTYWRCDASENFTFARRHLYLVRIYWKIGFFMFVGSFVAGAHRIDLDAEKPCRLWQTHTYTGNGYCINILPLFASICGDRAQPLSPDPGAWRMFSITFRGWHVHYRPYNR